MPDPARRFADRPLAAWQELFQSSPREEERYLALQAIAALSGAESAVRWMRQGLHDADSGVRAAAARWLSQQAGGATQPGSAEEWAAIRAEWQTLLTDSDPDVRFEAARGLLVLNSQDEQAAAVLLTMLHDADTQPAILPAVLKALSLGAGHLAGSSVDWQKLLQHDQAEVREQAARTLGLRGERSLVSATALLPLLDDDEPFVREEAAKAFGLLGIVTEDIRAALATAANDEDAIVAETAREALQHLPPPETTNA